MPIAVKLSKFFYDRFGDTVVGELVGLLNQVDAASHDSLRELNDRNFALFDAKLEQRTAETRADFHARFAKLDAKLEQRTAETRADFHARFVEFDAKLERLIADVRGEMRLGFGEIRVELHRMDAKLMRWMFGVWTAMMLAILGLYFR